MVDPMIKLWFNSNKSKRNVMQKIGTVKRKQPSTTLVKAKLNRWSES